MIYSCEKCSKVFKSNYLLDKHLNRKTPCDIILQCSKCNKMFATTRLLTNHLDRKTSCMVAIIDINLSKLELKLEIEKEKTLQISEKALMQTDLINKRAIAQADLISKRLSAKIFTKDKDLEKEYLKTKRKEITAQIVNEKILADRKLAEYKHLDYLRIKEEEAFKYVESRILTNEVVFDINELSHLLMHLIRNNILDVKKVFEEFTTIEECSTALLQVIFNNDEYPQFKSLFYFLEIDKYFIIKLINGIKKASLVNFNNIVPDITNLLLQGYRELHCICNSQFRSNERIPTLYQIDKYADILQDLNSKYYNMPTSTKLIGYQDLLTIKPIMVAPVSIICNNNESYLLPIIKNALN